MARVRAFALTVAVVSAMVGVPAGPAGAGALVKPHPGMVITKDTTFAPGVYDFPTGEGITIAADGVTVEGSGAVLRGPGVEGRPDSYAGTGVAADGVSGVRVSGLSVAGFDLAIRIRNGRDWTISGNNLSGNYTDPDFDWGDGPLAGALLLEHVHDSTIADNVARQNWNGLALHYADDNVVRDNDFSHCSNVCLKMWSASGNAISDNDFSYGIRVAPGETHARDSTSALIETGSNDNRILRNDFTHGGDGVFLRPLNGVVSTGNYFEGNDASYAHNNAWESWSPGNTYVGNKGNHSSYGFWLGNSDDTVLIGNEAAYNGRDNANAPEPFGNAGIAVVNGSSSHFVLDGNHVHDNTSVGVAIGYLADYPAYHWIIQRNRIQDNATYGIYLRDARWITLGDNEISGNESGAIQTDDNVSGVFTLPGAVSAHAPVARIASAPRIVRAGEPVTFDATASRDADGSTLNYRWEFGDGSVASSAVAGHRYLDPGFYRVGLTVDDGGLAGLDHLDLYVLGTEREIATDVGLWSGGDVSLDRRSVAGSSSIRFSGAAGDASWRYTSRSDLDVSDQDTMSFWLHSEQETRDGFAGTQPRIRLVDRDGDHVELTPTKNYLDPWGFPYYEARAGWQLVTVPLAGGRDWERSVSGTPRLDAVRSIELRTSAVGGPYRIWLDQLSFGVTPAMPDLAPNIALNPAAQGNPAPIASLGTDLERWAPLDGSATGAAWSGAAGDYYGVDFGVPRSFDRVSLSGAVAGVQVSYWYGGAWQDAEHQQVAGGVVTFDPVWASKVRVVLGGAASVTEFEVASRANLAGNREGAAAGLGSPVPLPASDEGWALLDGSIAEGVAGQGNAGVDLLRAAAISEVTVYLDDPAALSQVQAWTGSDWIPVSNAQIVRGDGVCTVRFDTTQTRMVRVLLGGPAVVRELEVRNANLLAAGSPLGLSLSPTASYTYPGDTVWGPLDGSYAAAPRWTSWNSKNAVDWYAVSFDRPVRAGRVVLHVYDDGGGVQPPADYTIEYRDGADWRPVTETGRSPAGPAAGFNAIDFVPVRASGFRFVGTNQNPVDFGVYVGLTEFELFVD